MRGENTLQQARHLKEDENLNLLNFKNKQSAKSI